MSLHKIGDTKSWRNSCGYIMSAKVKGRPVKGVYRRVTFIKTVMSPIMQEIPFYKGRIWQHTLKCTQRAYKRTRYFA